MADGGGGLGERVAPVDDRGEVAALDELGERGQVGGVLLRDEGAERLGDERGEQRRPDLAAAAAQQPSGGLAADDDQPSVRGEGAPEMTQPGVAADVEDDVEAGSAVGEVRAGVV